MTGAHLGAHLGDGLAYYTKIRSIVVILSPAWVTLTIHTRALVLCLHKDSIFLQANLNRIPR